MWTFRLFSFLEVPSSILRCISGFTVQIAGDCFATRRHRNTTPGGQRGRLGGARSGAGERDRAASGFPGQGRGQKPPARRLYFAKFEGIISHMWQKLKS